MRDDDTFQRVEDYTNAFLGAFGMVLMLGLVIVWDAWGYAVALILCAALFWGINRMGQRRTARDADWDARVEAILAKRR